GVSRSWAGINSAIVDAGTKYFAVSIVVLMPESFCVRTWEIFLLMIPSRHFLCASKTPDPELPVVATSRITVENLFTAAGNPFGDRTRDRTGPWADRLTTSSPGHGCPWHSGILRKRTLTVRPSSLRSRRAKSRCSNGLSFTTVAVRL